MTAITCIIMTAFLKLHFDKTVSFSKTFMEFFNDCNIYKIEVQALERYSWNISSWCQRAWLVLSYNIRNPRNWKLHREKIYFFHRNILISILFLKKFDCVIQQLTKLYQFETFYPVYYTFLEIFKLFSNALYLAVFSSLSDNVYSSSYDIK